MNSKAQRQSLEWPPLLNLSKDKPHVDPSFKNVEKVNTPYLNSMLQPLWKKSTGRKSTFDTYGNEYWLDESTSSTTTIHGDIIADREIQNRKFVKRELAFSGVPGEVLSFEPVYNLLIYKHNDGTVHAASYNLTTDVITNDYTLLDISTAIIIEARVKVTNSQGIFVVFYDINDIEFVIIARSGQNLANIYSVAFTSTWYRQVQGSFSTVSVKDIDPVIHIGSNNGASYVSLTNYTGEVIPGPDTYFQTYYIPSSGSNLLRLTQFNSVSSSSVTLNTQVDKYKVTPKKYVKTSTRTVVTRDNVNYYIYNANATRLSQLTRCYDIPAGYAYTSRAMTQALLETDTSTTPVNYSVYQFQETTVYFEWTVQGSASNYYALRVDVTLNGANSDGNAAFVNAQQPSPLEGAAIYNISNVNGQISFSVNPPTSDSRYLPKSLGSNTVGFSYKYYQGQATPTVRVNTGYVHMAYIADAGNVLYTDTLYPYELNSYKDVTYGTNSTTPIDISSWQGRPNIILDDGFFYFFGNFNYPTTWNSTGNIWTNTADCYSLRGTSPTISGSTLTTTPVSSGIFSLSTLYAMRGISFVVDQNFIGITLKACNAKSASPATLIKDKETGGSSFIEAFFSNAIGKIRYLPGTTRKSDWSYYSYSLTGNPALVGPSEDLLTFTPGGFRTTVNGSFSLLYNTYTSNYSYVQGISYTGTGIGTLLTPWQSVNNKYYVSEWLNNCVVYRSKDNKWIMISMEQGAELFTVLEDRLVVINTTSYLNCYDSKAKRWFHYATDYNGRVMHGSDTVRSFQGTVATGTSEYSAYPYIRYTANAINPLYSIMPRDVISSMILPIVPRYRCYVGEESYSTTVEAQQGIDVFWSDFTSTDCIYRKTLIRNSVETKHELQGLTYPGSISTSPSLSPNLFTKYINGAGNNDIVLEDYDAYTLTYYDNSPHLLYSSNTQVSNVYNDKNVFFVLQGQFYGVIGDKLYSLAYSQGAIVGMDAIIDLGDLQFIGNNPMISFWYDPATRVIRSFTGDANLEFLYSATKIKEYYQSWYDETSQSIFAATDAGLLVFGSRNTYLLEDYKAVSSVQFSNDGVTHITNNGITDNIRYYKEDGYEAIPLDFETSFYGLGATESTTIDRWNVTLYDLEGDHPESYITVGVRSLTDITVKSEEKTFKITPDMYDKWSNSVLISYSPKLIKGQGIRLYVKTPLTLQSVVPHIMDNKTGTTTRREL